ncbi:hypothetical protein SteCoe_31324 [Stentor coeruleus]|uniref:Amino acid transporter transmembrane domain-containing protein n=1 Tax=Stentor coeruleus TaxID=5963 RepID=A0A1R2B1S7_9CILI|nr:hypothetical protein SteCoe_31324 [Stentor coeruleus]
MGSGTEDLGESWFVGYAFTINSLIGAGILNIPWGYSQSGVLFGLIVQFVVALISMMLSYQTMQGWCRAETIARYREKGLKAETVPLSTILFDKPHNAFNNSQENQNLIDSTDVPTGISTRKFDFYEIIKLTLGKRMAFIFNIFLFIHILSSLVSYTSIFGTSLVSNISLFGLETCNIYDYDDYINECRYKYWIYVAIFACIMLTLCFFRFREQKWWQILMCSFRLIVFSIIIITTCIAIATNSELEDDGENNADPKIFDISAFENIVPVIFLANLFQNNLPTTTNFVRDKKKNVPLINNAALLTVISIFTCLGIISSYGIEDVEKMITLNWRDYSAGGDPNDKPWWCYAISYIVIILPALDIASAFPIICSNLCDNLLSVKYGYKKASELTQSVITKYNLVMASIPLVIGFFFNDLSIILEVAGTANVVDNAIFIPLFCLAAEKIIKEKTEFDFRYNYLISIIILIISALVFVAIFVFMIAHYI